MKRSELEKDVAYILDSFKSLDYEIPSNGQIMRVVFSKLTIVYVLQLFFIFIDIVLNSNSGEYDYFDTIVLALGTNLFFSLMFLMSTYNLVCMQIALGEEIRNKSVFLGVIEKKIGFHSVLLIFVNMIVGGGLLSAGQGFVAALGFSWFVTFLLSMLFLQGSLSRYMTPAVVSSISKVKELISASSESDSSR